MKTIHQEIRNGIKDFKIVQDKEDIWIMVKVTKEQLDTMYKNGQIEKKPFSEAIMQTIKRLSTAEKE